MSRLALFLIGASSALLLFASSGPTDEPASIPRLQLQSGDHICIIGNTLAERMQHDGWLETRLHMRFPKHKLVIRNLGSSGDELTVRLRSENFGSQDDWLKRCKANVVFAFFGYNESFAGEEGLEKFKKDLDTFIKHTLSQKYDGKNPPRLVLFSPIAHETLGDPNLPDGRENNKRIAAYTAAMAEVAKLNNVPFVDLFRSTFERYAKPDRPHTINGIHLNEHGNRAVAEVIDGALFGAADGNLNSAAPGRLREAIVDKNYYWFHRYRTTDGYSIYGGRADLKFVDGQTNRDVMQREMEVLDAMTANRDKRIWSLAAGTDMKVDDSNTPPFIPVTTNKPGPLSGGKHVFLDGEEAIQKMTVAKGLKVNLFADEKKFPELVNPVQMSWDPQGRLWVAVWPTYPHWKPKEEMNDKLLVLEDTDGDGKADKCTTFADGLHNPTGFELYNGGVLIAQAPDLMFLKDTNGDGKADVRSRVLHGLDSADTHHTSNSFVLDPGGGLYFQEGTFHQTQVETPYGPPRRCANAGVYRYEPRTQKFDVYITFGFANPHGHVFDRWGQDIVVDGTGSQPYHAALFSGHLDYPRKHSTPPQVYQQRTRPCPGMEFLSSRHFPETMQGNLLVANVIGFQGILQYKIEDNGASFKGTEVEPLLSSTDPNFRPSDIKVGPDGAVYFLDWHNPIIGHMQHNLRDPSRDREHGRIYRVTCDGRPLLKSPKIAGAENPRLLQLLKEPEDRVRHRARIELGGRETSQVIAALKKWTAELDPTDADHEHHLLEALWLHQSHNVINVDLLNRVLASPEFRARAAAARVLCYWRDRVPASLNQFIQLAADSHPRIRLEAVRAASFFNTPEAIEVVLVASAQPTDIYIDFVSRETMKSLDPFVKTLVASRKPLAFTSANAKREFARLLSTEDLLRLDLDRDVCMELLCRKGIREEIRREAASALAKDRKTDEVAVLVETVLEFADAFKDRERLADSVIVDLMRLATIRGSAPLLRIRPQLEKMAVHSARNVVCETAFVALVEADGNPDKAWELAAKSGTAMPDLLNAVPLLRDPAHRASLYPNIEAVLNLHLGSKDARVRHAAMSALTSIRGKETDTFKLLAKFAGSERDRDAVVHGLLRISSVHWPKEEAKLVLEQLVSHVRRVPAKERTKPELRDALQLADSIAALLPPAEANVIRKQLGDLGVRVIRIGTVPDQMLFDQERIVVKAGRPVEISFENTDMMPHNLVLTQPGALEEIGMQAESTATVPDALQRQYVPRSSKIILASKLLQPRETQRLSFTAPKEPGVYPYVCTYPGHWRRMYGAMYVVDDLDAYHAEPDAYLAKQQITAADPLLKSIRPRVEWRMEDLAPAVDALSNGRSFANGKQMFQIASCAACHKMNGVGVDMGPDLAKLDPKQQKPIEVLRDLLEPSFRINEKYQSYVFAMQSGQVVTGLVLEETPESVKVVENPLVKTDPVVLKKSEIAERAKSPTSVMPKGILDKLTREEILDLIAYVLAGGDAKHALFTGGHDHGHRPGH